MNQITNSGVRDQFRRNNENTVRSEEYRIRNELTTSISKLKEKQEPRAKPYICAGIIIGLVLVIPCAAGGGTAAMIGLFSPFIIALFIWKGSCANVRAYNKKRLEQIDQMTKAAEDEIRREYEKADAKTQSEIKQYDAEVSQYFKKIKSNKDSIERIVQYAFQIFESVLNVEIGKAANSERFVNASLSYVVQLNGVQFTYVLYTPCNYGYKKNNSFAFYDFKTERYRCLTKDSECEALAAAIMKQLGGYILKKYEPSQAKLSYSYYDANVTLNFEMPNKNFVPATVII